MSKLLSIQNISKKYDSEPVIFEFSLDLERGDSVAILGPSGIGKSTLLKCINRLLDIDSGAVFFKSKSIYDYEIRELRSKISYLFQKGLIFPHLTVEENIKLAISSCPDSYGKVLSLLNLVELDPEIFLKRYPRELSGGQSQRVALAQAMAIDPDLLLLDEPFNALDKEIKLSLIKKLNEIRKTQSKTFILVSHDREEAEMLSDRILELN
jgi:osmoprotectant transport system ATP-binding protein